MSDDAKTIIHEEIQKIPGYKKTTADSIMIKCPFHEDSTPSCGIYMSEGMQIPIGFFNCLGCDAKGSWNKLAEALDLRKIKNWQREIVGNSDDLLIKARKMGEDLLEEKTLNSLVKKLGGYPILPWTEDTEWRGYPGKLIKDVGGHFLLDTSMDENSIICFFPVEIEGNFYGGVKAYLEKQIGMLSYVGTKGDWVKKYGLFPYKLVQEFNYKWELDYVVLVEGPRDALRLISEGIPALAVLGSQNISVGKLNQLKKFGVEFIYSLADNDSAGDAFRKALRPMCKEANLGYKGIKFPKPKKKGKLVKIDPDNCSKELMRKIKNNIKNERGVGKRKKGWKRKKGK